MNLLAATSSEVSLTLALIFAFVIVLVAIRNVRKVLETRETERTKREVAAYIAEGTIRPEDAPKILGTQTTSAEQAIAEAVKWGTIKPEKAEGLIRAMREAKS
jgi:hypothetical protein